MGFAAFMVGFGPRDEATNPECREIKSSVAWLHEQKVDVAIKEFLPKAAGG